MKKLVAVIVVLCIVVGIYFFAKKNSGSGKLSATPGSNGVSNSAVNANNPSRASLVSSSGAGANSSSATSANLAANASSPGARSNAAPDLAPLTVLENMRSAIRNYGTTFGGNPVGNNFEITAALNANNPRQINFLPSDSGLRVNDSGELVDAWGTPFFFHQLSGTVMEIHSAGPDRKLWTLDDLVTK